jgi:hypothetical protein
MGSGHLEITQLPKLSVAGYNAADFQSRFALKFTLTDMPLLYHEQIPRRKNEYQGDSVILIIYTLPLV